MSVPNFPNLFLAGGPHTFLGHGGSVIYSLEVGIAQCRIDLRIGGIELPRQLVLDHCLFETIECGESLCPVGVVLGRALFHAIERIPRLAIGRIGAHHFRVLDDRAVVVLRLFGAMSGSQPGGGRASKQARERQRRSAGANINGPANQHR